MQRHCLARVEPQHPDHPAFVAQGPRQRQPHVGGVGDAEFFPIAFHHIGDAQEHFLPVIGRKFRPFALKGPTCRGHGSVDILGPAPAPITMLRGRHRRRLLVKTGRQVNIQQVPRDWLTPIKLETSVRLQVDVDPYSFM